MSSEIWLVVAIYLLIPFLFIAFVIAALRGEHDESGRRSKALYLGAISLVTVIAILSSIGMITHSILMATHLNDYKICNDTSSSYLSGVSAACDNSASNQIWQSLVQSGLVLLVSGYLFVWHRNRIKDLKAESGYVGSAAERSTRAFAFLIAFIAVLVIAVGKIGAAYSIFQVISPGVFGAANRGAAIRDFIQLAIVALEGWALLLIYRDETGIFITWPFMKSKSETPTTPVA